MISINFSITSKAVDSIFQYSREKNGGHSKPYNKFLYKLKKRTQEKDGHLLDIGVCYPKKTGEPLYVSARKRLDASAAKLAS